MFSLSLSLRLHGCPHGVGPPLTTLAQASLRERAVVWPCEVFCAVWPTSCSCLRRLMVISIRVRQDGSRDRRGAGHAPGLRRPARLRECHFGPVGQRSEQGTLGPRALGSNPSGLTRRSSCRASWDRPTDLTGGPSPVVPDPATASLVTAGCAQIAGPPPRPSWPRCRPAAPRAGAE